MRIWGVPVTCMCKKHLMGEHVEMHMFKATIEAGKSVDGYVRDKLLDTHRVVERHELLVREMLFRGYNHTSGLYSITYPPGFVERTSVDQNASELELARRCPDCRHLLECHYGKARFAHLPVGGDAVRQIAPNCYTVMYNGAVIDTFYNVKKEKAVLFLEKYRRTMRNGTQRTN